MTDKYSLYHLKQELGTGGGTTYSFEISSAASFPVYLMNLPAGGKITSVSFLTESTIEGGTTYGGTGYGTSGVTADTTNTYVIRQWGGIYPDSVIGQVGVWGGSNSVGARIKMKIARNDYLSAGTYDIFDLQEITTSGNDSWEWHHMDRPYYLSHRGVYYPSIHCLDNVDDIAAQTAAENDRYIAQDANDYGYTLGSSTWERLAGFKMAPRFLLTCSGSYVYDRVSRIFPRFVQGPALVKNDSLFSVITNPSAPQALYLELDDGAFDAGNGTLYLEIQ